MTTRSRCVMPHPQPLGCATGPAAARSLARRCEPAQPSGGRACTLQQRRYSGTLDMRAPACLGAAGSAACSCTCRCSWPPTRAPRLSWPAGAGRCSGDAGRLGSPRATGAACAGGAGRHEQPPRSSRLPPHGAEVRRGAWMSGRFCKRQSSAGPASEAGSLACQAAAH